jgi:hypothetical protein
MTKDAVNPLSRHVRHRLRGTCASDPTLPQLGLAVEQQSPRPEDLESDEAGLQRQSSCRTGSPRPNRSQGRVQRTSRLCAEALFCRPACEPAGTLEGTWRPFECRIHARYTPSLRGRNHGAGHGVPGTPKKGADCQGQLPGSCRSPGRTRRATASPPSDFKFYQAFYSRSTGTIEHAEIGLLKFNF